MLCVAMCKVVKENVFDFACLVVVCKGFKGNFQILSLCAMVVRSWRLCCYVGGF